MIKAFNQFINEGCVVSNHINESLTPSEVLGKVQDCLNDLISKETLISKVQLINLLNNIAPTVCAYNPDMTPSEARDEAEESGLDREYVMLYVTIYENEDADNEEYDMIITGNKSNRKWIVKDHNTEADR